MTLVEMLKEMYGDRPFTAKQVLADLPEKALPVTTQWRMDKKDRIPAMSLGKVMAGMPELEKIARTRDGVIWRVR